MKTTGLGDRFFLDGFDISGDVGAIQSISMTRALIDVTGLDKDSFERLTGLGDCEMSWNAWFNASAGQSHPVMRNIPDGRHAMYFRGITLGSSVAAMVGTQANYNVNRQNDGAAAVSAQIMNKSGDLLDWGKALTAGKVTSTSAVDLAGLDGNDQGFEFGSDGQLRAYLQVFAFTGTDVTFTLEDSDDDGDMDCYAPIMDGAFTQVTAAPAKERIEVDGPIKRWVRLSLSGTFSSVTYAVAIRRLGPATEEPC